MEYIQSDIGNLAINGKNNKVGRLILTDPITKRTMVTIRSPKLKICRFQNNGENCIDLAKYMNEIDVTPDFGFDGEELVVENFE